MAVFVLVRRAAKRSHVDAFLAAFESESLDFVTENLTRAEAADVSVIRDLGLTHPITDGEALLNIALVQAFNPLPGFFDPEVECEPRKRAILYNRSRAN